MNCQDVMMLLPEFAASRLDDANLQMVEAHLQTCDACRHEAGEIADFTAFTRSITIEPGEAPIGFLATVWPKLYVRIRETGLQNAPLTLWDRLRGWFQNPAMGRFQWVNLSAIAVTALILVFSLQRDEDIPQSGLFQIPLSSVTALETSQIADGVQAGQDVLTDVLTLGFNESDNPLEQLDALLTPGDDGDTYEEVTDYLAEMLVKLDKRV
jgi:hypothetical protein